MSSRFSAKRVDITATASHEELLSTLAWYRYMLSTANRVAISDAALKRTHMVIASLLVDMVNVLAEELETRQKNLTGGE